MNEIIAIISKWSAQGQGAFFVFLVLIAVGVIQIFGRALCILVRGWPPQPPDDAEIS